MQPSQPESQRPVAPKRCGAAVIRLSTAVREARRKRKMSCEALAEQSGVSLPVVQDLERGFPVAQPAVAAVCRNLDLAEPQLDRDPLVQLALLLRERRERTRLSRVQLAALAGLVPKTIKSIESASHWPNPETCAGLLSVKALELGWQDVAAFASRPAARGEPASDSAQSEEASSPRTGGTSRCPGLNVLPQSRTARACLLRCPLALAPNLLLPLRFGSTPTERCGLPCVRPGHAPILLPRRPCQLRYQLAE